MLLVQSQMMYSKLKLTAVIKHVKKAQRVKHFSSISYSMQHLKTARFTPLTTAQEEITVGMVYASSRKFSQGQDQFFQHLMNQSLLSKQFSQVIYAKKIALYARRVVMNVIGAMKASLMHWEFVYGFKLKGDLSRN